MGTRRRGGVMDDGGKEQEPGSLLRHPVVGGRGHVSELEYRVEPCWYDCALEALQPSCRLTPSSLGVVICRLNTSGRRWFSQE